MLHGGAQQLARVTPELRVAVYPEEVPVVVVNGASCLLSGFDVQNWPLKLSGDLEVKSVGQVELAPPSSRLKRLDGTRRGQQIP